jgi:activator of HSP90 ATPase
MFLCIDGCTYKFKEDTMNERTNAAAWAHAPTRRQIATGIAMVLGGLAAGSRTPAEGQQQTMKEIPPTAANKSRTSLHEVIDMKAGPQRIYEALLDAKQFAAFTGLPAEIDPKAGGTFSMFGGLIVGRNIELVPNQRIVQAWRPSHWDPGIYSIVKFELKPQSSGTTVVLDHKGFPEGDFDSLDFGWHAHYWEPLKKFLA